MSICKVLKARETRYRVYENFLYYIHNCVVNITLSKIKNFTRDQKRRWKDAEVRYGEPEPKICFRVWQCVSDFGGREVVWLYPGQKNLKGNEHLAGIFN